MIPEEYSNIHQKGEQALLQKKYEEALRHFKKVLKQFPDFPPALRSAGACNELKGDFEEASGFYQRVIEANPYFSRALYYECGKALYQSGKYRKALAVFEQFDTLRHLEPIAFIYNGMEEQVVEREYYAKLSSSIQACQTALDSIRFWNISSVFNLGNAINSNADEYFPYLTNDGRTIFYTSRKNERADENLFFSTSPKGEWRIGEKVISFNTDENEGMTTLVRDGRRMFFTACQRPQVLGPCDIWEAKLDGYQVFPEGPVIGYANSGSWESQASISCDGSQLFFASDREGGQGGTDIWMSQRMEDNRWSEPVNLGPKVNTDGDEEAPFISNDGRVLYFSSTGHLGLGEQDMFMSRLQPDSTWGHATNLGMPVNSPYRELGFFLTADGRTGYFASNRKGGYGGMDIYRFDLPEKLSSDPITYVEGYVRDSITRLPVKTTVLFKNHPPAQTDDEGRFFLCLPANDTLKLEIRAEEYRSYRNQFQIPLWDNKVYFSLNILLDPLFRLPVYTETAQETGGTSSPPLGMTNELRHAVLFNFDGADLRPEEITKLNDFLNTSISGKPVLGVEVIGYADDIGSDAYNLVLSEKRAKNVGVYLKNKGIRVDKVYLEGKGETSGPRPKNQNRRVEVVVYQAK
jgi:outer membrane protein OmpA-like peptidoglycan-associated protein